MLRIVFVALLLGGCSLPDMTYVVDGVPVICEQGYGPPRGNMQHAVSIYRENAREYFQVDEQEELQVWRSLRGIRWTKRPVANYVKFDPELETIDAMWLGCIVNVEFFQELTKKYMGVDNVREQDLDWAWTMERNTADELCQITAEKRFYWF